MFSSEIFASPRKGPVLLFFCNLSLFISIVGISTLSTLLLNSPILLMGGALAGVTLSIFLWINVRTHWKELPRKKRLTRAFVGSSSYLLLFCALFTHYYFTARDPQAFLTEPLIYFSGLIIIGVAFLTSFYITSLNRRQMLPIFLYVVGILLLPVSLFTTVLNPSAKVDHLGIELDNITLGESIQSYPALIEIDQDHAFYEGAYSDRADDEPYYTQTLTVFTNDDIVEYIGTMREGEGTEEGVQIFDTFEDAFDVYGTTLRSSEMGMGVWITYRDDEHELTFWAQGSVPNLITRITLEKRQ